MHTAPRHVIIEGLPATGKSEIGNLLKIYFPESLVYLPELTTEIVRKYKFNILDGRRILSDRLIEELPVRKREIRGLLEKMPAAVILEESHIGLHWAYSKVLADDYLLENYKKLEEHFVKPDLFIRLMQPPVLSIKRQHARHTPDVAVGISLITQMLVNLDEWHAARGHDNLIKLDVNRSPDLVVAEMIRLLGLKYGK